MRSRARLKRVMRRGEKAGLTIEVHFDEVRLKDRKKKKENIEIQKTRQVESKRMVTSKLSIPRLIKRGHIKFDQ